MILNQNTPILPGVATISDAMQVSARCLSTMKFFPTEASGGTAYLNAFAGPLRTLKFCPTGGVTRQTTPDYLALNNVICVGGTWIAPKSLIKAGDWATITANAKLATRIPSLQYF